MFSVAFSIVGNLIFCRIYVDNLSDPSSATQVQTYPFSDRPSFFVPCVIPISQIRHDNPGTDSPVLRSTIVFRLVRRTEDPESTRRAHQSVRRFDPWTYKINPYADQTRRAQFWLWTHQDLTSQIPTRSICSTHQIQLDSQIHLNTDLSSYSSIGNLDFHLYYW